MRFYERRFEELFDFRKSYSIPMYQRAYEWDTNEKNKKNQVREFWEDINEFLESNSDFPLGNFTFLRMEDYKWEIIDGQQRITTILILIKSILDKLKKFDDEYYKEYAENLYKKYFKNKEIKFNPQEYDKNFWEDFILLNNNVVPATPSQKKIKEAKEFFDNQLKDKDTKFLEKLLGKLEHSIIGFIEIDDKKEATSIFEFQNDRGKNLTNLDKLKSFFMHQIYVCDGDEQDIKYIYREFEDIYKMINNFQSINEDNILTYHIQAHTNLGFDYRNITQLKNNIKNIKNFEERLGYIKKFSRELKESFIAIQNFLNDDKEYACYLKDLSRFKFAFAYPFIIKAYKYFSGKTLEYFLKYLERVVFVHNIVFTSAYIESRLNEFLKKLDENTDIYEFFKEIAKRLVSERFWQNKSIEQTLEGNMYTNISRYLLKRYEIELRKKSDENYIVDLVCNFKIYEGIEDKKVGWWLEHIAPRTEKPESGYEAYDEEFKNEYLNSIGNLLLTSDSHNIKLGNKPFVEKLSSYKKSSMEHHREVENFSQNNIWTKKSIMDRRKHIIQFVLDTWSLEKIIN